MSNHAQPESCSGLHSHSMLQVAPYFQLVSQQKPRQDLQYLTPEPETQSDTEDDSDTDLEMAPWTLFYVGFVNGAH